MMPFYGISVVTHKYQYNVNIADEVYFNQKITVVLVVLSCEKPPLRFAMPGLHLSKFTCSRRSRRYDSITYGRWATA